LKIVARALFFDRFGWFKIALPTRMEAGQVAPKPGISSERKQLSLNETPLDPEAL
jgi:hypothetical protein